jgi:TolA-binding protein
MHRLMVVFVLALALCSSAHAQSQSTLTAVIESCSKFEDYGPRTDCLIRVVTSLNNQLTAVQARVQVLESQNFGQQINDAVNKANQQINDINTRLSRFQIEVVGRPGQCLFWRDNNAPAIFGHCNVDDPNSRIFKITGQQ